MKPVDFSCKHDILICRPDGSLVPMDEPAYDVELLAPGTWKIMSSGDFHYLLEGDDEAVAIDTGYGAGNLREFLEGLCGKPVRWCINTHHHFDHSANNCYFETVFMAAESEPLAAIPYKSFEGITFPRDYGVKIVGDGDIIPLKGRELEIFRIGDHTEGGIAILDRKQRILFSGDEIMPDTKVLRNTVEKLHSDMGKLMPHRGEFDTLCGGPAILTAEEVDIYFEASGRILAGEPGENVQREERRPPEHSIDPNAPKIYHWQRPHPEDAPTGKMRSFRENSQYYYWRGREFVFSKLK